MIHRVWKEIRETNFQDPYILNMMLGKLFDNIKIISVDFNKMWLAMGQSFYTTSIKTTEFNIKLTSHSFVLEVDKDDVLVCYDIFGLMSSYGYDYALNLIESFKIVVEDFTGQTFDEFTDGKF